MRVLENIFLRKRLENLQLRVCFTEIQKLAKPRLSEATSEQLYVKYMEEVLLKKEQHLAQLEQQLENRSLYLAKQERDLAKQPMLQMNTIEQIQLMLDNLREQLVIPLLKNNITSTTKLVFQQYSKKEQQILHQCQWKKQLADSLLNDQYDKIAKQKKILNQKIGHFQSLQSYETYLNELQEMLETKAQQIEERKNQQLPKCNSNQLISSKQPVRRRVKIFQSKTSNNSNINLADYNHTFGNSQSTIKEQSTIRGQNQHDEQKIQDKKLNFVNEKQKYEFCSHVSLGTQINEESADEVWKRLKKQRLRVKFLRLWFKFSDGKNSLEHKKCMFLYQWRLNACYDQDAPEKINSNLSILDKQWLKRCEILKSQKLYPYHQLSIKRKRYLQLFFDYERRLLHHKNQCLILSSITRNKNRKQKLMFLLYFKKWKTRSQTQVSSKCIKQEISATNVCNNTESRTSNNFSRSSSHLLLQNRERSIKNDRRHKQNNKTDHPLFESELTDKKIPQKISKGKQNEVSSQSNISQVDLKKLKTYIKEKEQIQKILAIKYLRSQGLCKLSFTINPKVLTLYNIFLDHLKKDQSETQIKQAQNELAATRFKCQLFITKCRLALANNSNKINHLEQMLGFSILQK